MLSMSIKSADVGKDFPLTRVDLRKGVIYEVRQNGMILGRYAWRVEDMTNGYPMFMTDAGVIYRIEEPYKSHGSFRETDIKSLTLVVEKRE